MDWITLHKFGIRFRVTVTAILTLAGIAVLSSMLISDKYSTLQQNNELSKTMVIYQHIGNLIHELQEERSLSMIFALDKRRSEAKTKLDIQRGTTNTLLEIVHRELSKSKKHDLDTSFLQKMTVTISLLTFLENVRASIDDPKLTDPNEFFFFYSKVNHSLVSLMSQFISISPNAQVSQKAGRYIALFSAISSISKQRDLGVKLFFDRKSAKKIENEISKLHGMETTFLTTYQENSDRRHSAEMKTYMDSLLAKKWRAAYDELIFNHGAKSWKEWHSLATENKDSLLTQLTDTFAALNQSVETSTKKARTDLTVVALMFLGFTSLLLFFLYTVFGVTTPLLRLTKVMARLAKGDSNVEIRDTQRTDELGDLVKAVEIFKAHLIERDEVMKNLVSAKTAAEKATRVKADFLATMSHEIRTPMNGILGMTNLVLDNDLDSDSKELVGTIRDCGNNLLTIINDILDFSKMDAGKLELETKPFDLKASISAVVALLEPKAKEKDLTLFTQLDPDVPRYVSGDVTRVKQIILNLAGNAIKFTEKGHVAVRGKLVDDHKNRFTLEFMIEDTGIGISKEQEKRLFQSFSQADGSTTRKYGGTGLGLVISKRLAECMDGTMWVESEFGKGSKFCFRITVQGASEKDVIDEVSQVETLERELGNNHPLRILIAEDNKVNQTLALRLLGKMGYAADIAQNGREAVTAVANKAYDIILMDVQMPEMDGLQATQEITSTYSKTDRPRIVAMTANAMSEDRERCLEAGMDSYLSKPINFSALKNELAGTPCRHPEEVLNNSNSSESPTRQEDYTNSPSPTAKADPKNDDEWKSILLAQFAGDEDLLSMTSSLYLEHYDDFMKKIEIAIAEQDPKKVQESAHSLKGTIANFRVESVTELANQLETMGRDGNVSAAAKVFKDLQTQSLELNQRLSQFIRQAA